MVQDPRIRIHSGTALPGTTPKYSQANVLGLELFEADSAGENGAQCEEHIIHRHDLPQREAILNPFLPIGNAATTDSCDAPLTRATVHGTAQSIPHGGSLPKQQAPCEH